MTEPEMIDSLRVHRFEPGDRLLITSEHSLDQNTADRIKAIAEAWSGVPVLILGEGMGVEVARGLPDMASPTFADQFWQAIERKAR